ncbi:MAG: hypothetical protein JO055_12265 [Alphaproteobacteria bacterium]|nr:hypothetical protein [Alphaproteobacteria bacterium]
MSTYRLLGILFIVTGVFLGVAALLTPPWLGPVKPMGPAGPSFQNGAQRLK